MTPERMKNLGIKRAILDRFEDKMAVFKLDNGQELEWSKDELPRDFKVGDEVNLKLVTSASETKEREEIARKLLGEILEKTK
ncbi:DUF3006 domain-containing protein [Patescibacteria group bacterium]|nr:MAG: DUF3006 domain-containing protein [Patescibacteria group bacterium]